MAKEGRRGNGEGSIYELADGTWRGFITLGYDRDGKQIRKFCRGKTRRAVAERLNAIAAQSGSRLVQRPEKVTVEEWLRRYAALRSRELRPRTRALYSNYLNRIAGALGGVLLQRLTPLQIRVFYAELMDAGLSPSTRQHIHHFFKAALREALRLELVERTPFDVIDTPKGGRIVTPRVWDPAEVRTFLAAAEGDRLYGAFYLMVTLGLRIGETMGLQWKDLEGERLHVRRTLTFEGNTPVLGPPKTRRGDRVIYLGSDVQRVLDQQRETQALERSMAPRWKDLDLIFSTSVGTLVETGNVRRSFRRLVEAAGVPMIRVHDLRHTYITLARDAGLDAEVVAERVGQDVRVTMKIYSKVTESRKRKAAKTLGELLDDKPS